MYNLLDKISEEEYKMLDNYRSWYACGDASLQTHAPIRTILKPWAESNITLYQLLGENLTITKEFTYEKDKQELLSEMCAMINNYRSYGRTNRGGYKFVEFFRNWVEETYPVINPPYDPYTLEDDWSSCTDEEKKNSENNRLIRKGLFNLINYYTLAENVYKGHRFSIKLNNDKVYVIDRGCKPMRALSKIVQAYNLPYFEDFRICHSQIHNQKILKGNITLSIHPLDYWTMSDNSCGWDSCMNWQDGGGYKQGTVEMMNSECVVVAYLNASEKMAIGHNSYWSNKKWRELFIVHEDLILGIKDYPYYNEQLNLTVANWLKELAETNMGWKYSNSEPIHYSSDSTLLRHPEHPDEEFRIRFITENMYNDIGCISGYHPLYLGEDCYPSKLGAYNNYYEFYYSGLPECMNCGATDPALYDEGSLCCESCDIEERCEYCDERIDTTYYIDGMKICNYCYDEYVRDCDICDEPHLHQNMKNIYIIPRMTFELQEEANKWKNVTNDSYHAEYITSGYVIDVCNDCWTEFIQEYLKPNAKVTTFVGEWTEYYDCIYIDELTDKGLELLPSHLLDMVQQQCSIEEIINNCYHVAQLKVVKYE